MVARVASGTLAGSRSGSWASIHKEAARSDFSRFRRHPPVVRLAQLSRTVAESDVVVGHDFRNRENQQREVGVTAQRRSAQRPCSVARTEVRGVCSSVRIRRPASSWPPPVCSGRAASSASLTVRRLVLLHLMRRRGRAGALLLRERGAVRRDRRSSRISRAGRGVPREPSRSQERTHRPCCRAPIRRPASSCQSREGAAPVLPIGRLFADGGGRTGEGS